MTGRWATNLMQRRSYERAIGGDAVSEIKPALTAEEWAREGTRAIADRDDYARFRSALDALTEYDSTSFRTRSEMRRAVAAHALHCQPFGFTQMHVDELRGGADAMDGTFLAICMRDIADRIAALLPPEAP